MFRLSTHGASMGNIPLGVQDTVSSSEQLAFIPTTAGSELRPFAAAGLVVSSHGDERGDASAVAMASDAHARASLCSSAV